MVDVKERALQRGRRSARTLHRVASITEGTARRIDRVVARVDRVDGTTLTSAWTDVRHPGRRKGRLLAATALGALAVIAASRVWHHVAHRDRAADRETTDAAAGTPLEWHVDRADGEWQVLDLRHQLPRSTHRTQNEAIAAAERSLADLGGGTVVVHALDGRPRDERRVEAATGGGRPG